MYVWGGQGENTVSLLSDGWQGTLQIQAGLFQYMVHSYLSMTLPPPPFHERKEYY